MKLVRLRLQNFRSYRAKNSERGIAFRSGINLIVGENNVGKSNLLKALDLLKGELQLTPNDYYGGEKNEKEVFLELEAQFTARELKEILRYLTGFMKTSPSKVEKLEKELREAYFSFSSKAGLFIRVADLYIRGSEAKLTSDFSATGYPAISWKQVFETYCNSPELSISATARAEIEKTRDPNARITFGWDLGQGIQRLLKEKLKIFSEVRQRPSGKNERILESYDGSLVADVLATLKMGNRQQRKNFESIKKEFNSLFPTLQLEVTKKEPNLPPEIVIEKTPIEYEVPIERVGAGIGEMVILLTHLIASKEMVFGLDMPELHFHPHSQRLLLDILRERSSSNQILIVTHSPMFLQPKEIDNIMVAREQNGETVVTQLPEHYFSKAEKTRLERNLSAYGTEFFFSRASLVVEGPTETGAIPIFSKALDKDFDKYGVSIVETGKHFDIMVKLLKGFKFPYVVMSDRDCLMNIEECIKINGRKVKTSTLFCNLEKIGLLKKRHKMRILKLESEISSGTDPTTYKAESFDELSKMARIYNVHVLPSNFEGVLSKSGYNSLLEEAGRISESKVTCGRLIAQEMTEQKLKIPDEFIEVINDIIAKAESRP